MTAWMFGCLAALSSGFTLRYSDERKKSDMAVEEGAVSLTQVSIAVVLTFGMLFFK